MSRLVEQPVEQLIGMGRIVMKGHKPLDTSPGGEGYRLVAIHFMSPTHMCQVFSGVYCAS